MPLWLADLIHRVCKQICAIILTLPRQQPNSAVWTENPALYPRIRQQPERPAAGAYMAFFQSAVGVLQTLVIALGAGLGIWGAINLLEGYGNDNPGANAHVW